jgi:hypothetical protein
MNSFTITYTVKFVLSTHPEYVWNKFDECFNLKTEKLGKYLRMV